jgi:hypothetical protein
MSEINKSKQNLCYVSKFYFLFHQKVRNRRAKLKKKSLILMNYYATEFHQKLCTRQRNDRNTFL